jgi:hypothetical protein
MSDQVGKGGRHDSHGTKSSKTTDEEKKIYNRAFNQISVVDPDEFELCYQT